MWSSWLSDTSIPALEQSLNFSQRRHMLLAGNIANKDVPGYQTRDLSVDQFQQALKESLELSKSGGSNNYLTAGERSAKQVQAADKVRDLSSQVLYLDGSDVNFEQQITQVSKNYLFHDTAIALMRSQFQTLRSAISESANV